MKQRELKLNNTANNRQMEKTKGRSAFLYSIIAVIAGVLSGVLIASFLWKDEKVPSFKDIFGTEKSESGISEEKPVSSEKRDNGVQAEYKITKGQKYYTRLVEDGDKNILLVGEDATSGNYDTIIIASVSDKNKTVRLINFPRDIYIDYSEDVLNLLKEKSPKLYGAKGFQKINAAHTVGSRIEYENNMGRFRNSDIDFLADLIEEVFMIRVDDYAYVNTKGFREIVDLFGGVEINVPVRMKYDDPTQDLYIDLQPGLQRLNGEKAEWFVRFRQGYDNNGVFRQYSDEFRKENQNEFLKAFFKQHVNLKNIGKVDELSKLIGENIRTSVIGVQKISEYMNLLRKVLNKNYDQQSQIIESFDKNINGVYFKIIRTE